MEFGWTEDLVDIRQRTRAFLAANLPANWEEIAAQSPGSQAVTEFSKVFCHKLAEAGLFAPHWPKEFGGADASPWQYLMIGEEMWRHGEPRGPQYYNVNWLGPTIMKYGTAEQREYHLGRMLKGDVVWCQGFSEPSSGSDLASLRTMAERQGDRFVINGSKIWTSYAGMAEFCLLLARTRAEGRRAITVFLVPMDRPGITVRPIPSVVGDGDLHELFFDNVEALDSEILGEEGAGWDVVRYALNYERIGIPRYALARRTLDRAVEALIAKDAFTPVAELAAALALATCEAARIMAHQAIDERARSAPSRGQTSLTRYAIIRAENEVAEFVLDWTPHLFASDDQPMVATHHKRAVAAGVAAGAAEIQLNLIARDILGLGVNA